LAVKVAVTGFKNVSPEGPNVMMEPEIACKAKATVEKKKSYDAVLCTKQYMERCEVYIL
jgi:hypothetical protein